MTIPVSITSSAKGKVSAISLYLAYKRGYIEGSYHSVPCIQAISGIFCARLSRSHWSISVCMYIHTHFKLQTIEKLIQYIRFCVRYLHLVNLIDSPHIRPSVNDRCPGFFFGFRRKLACTKTQQSTDKSIEHNGRTVFTWVLVLLTRT